jgi:tRNA nucleotidyltransferase/poly(A) polymerase
VSPERVRDELLRMLSLPDPTAALRVADRLGLLKMIVPEVEPLHGMAQEAPHAFDAWNHTLAVVEHLAGILATISPKRTDETAAQFSRGMVVMALDVFRSRLQTHIAQLWPDERPHRALLLLAALLHDTGKALGEGEDTAQASARIAERRANGLRLSNGEQVRLVKVIQLHRVPLEMDDFSDLSLHRFWRKAGEAGVDACLLALADYLGTVGHYFDQDSWIVILERLRKLLDAYYERHAKVVEPPVLVDGNALMEALDVERGPVIGKLLTLIREAQVTGEVQTAEDALRLARAYVKQKG